jgi:PAS domain S-box-containing protein
LAGGAQAPQLGWLAAVLDLMPTPLVLIEPGTARVTFANRAADRLAGGEFPRDVPAEGYEEAYHCTDAAGHRVPAEEMPGVRAARGERLRNVELDWHTPGGVRSLLVSSDLVPAVFGQPETIVVPFEDVTALKRAEQARAAQAGAYEQLYQDAEAAQGRSVEALALLDTLFETAPVGLAYFDRELRYVRINDALAEINGVPAPEHLGRTVPEVLPEMDPEVVVAFRRVIETGEPIVDMPVAGATPASPGEVRHWSGSWYPVRGADGEILGLGAVVLETTDRQRAVQERERAYAAEREARERAERAERRARFLAEASATVAETLDYEDTLRRLASLAVPDRAQWCAIDMLAADGSIERVALAHADPAKERYGWELSRRWPVALDDADGVARVVRTGVPQLLAEVDDELLARSAADAEHLRVIRELGLRSAMIVPLRERGRVLGTLTFVSSESGPRYDEEDLGVAQELAARAGVAVENARLYRSRSAIARTLQESLLPPHLPAIPGLELAARYRPAGEGNEVGGDFYDVFATGEDHWAVVIGDVCGKGAEAAALTALMRYTLRAAAVEHDGPSEILGQLNQAILSQRSDGRFSTAAFVRLALHGGEVALTVASGGHPLPLLVRADGRVEAVGEPGTLLGVLPDVRHTDADARLRAGDAIVLFTDGLTEAGAPDRVMSSNALAELASSCAGLGADGIARRVEEHAVALQDGEARDDLALVVARVPG